MSYSLTVGWSLSSSVTFIHTSMEYCYILLQYYYYQYYCWSGSNQFLGSTPRVQFVFVRSAATLLFLCIYCKVTVKFHYCSDWSCISSACCVDSESNNMHGRVCVCKNWNGLLGKYTKKPAVYLLMVWVRGGGVWGGGECVIDCDSGNLQCWINKWLKERRSELDSDLETNVVCYWHRTAALSPAVHSVELHCFGLLCFYHRSTLCVCPHRTSLSLDCEMGMLTGVWSEPWLTTDFWQRWKNRHPVFLGDDITHLQISVQWTRRKDGRPQTLVRLLLYHTIHQTSVKRQEY